MQIFKGIVMEDRKNKKKEENVAPLLMTQEYWTNTHYSIARHTGGVRIDGKDYIVVDKFGRSLYETSIPAGATADLIYVGLQKSYKKLGREVILEALNKGKTFSEIKAMKKPAKGRKSDAVQTELNF